MSANRKNRRTQYEHMIRDEIRDAVINILSSEGATGLTMERVAAEAGMAKATLYGYFRGKQQLLEWVREASLEPLRAQAKALLEGELRPEEKIRRLVLLHLVYFDRNRGFFRVLLWERQTSLADLKKRRTHDSFRKHLDRIAEMLRAGVKAKVFKPIDEARTAAMLMDAVISLNRQRLLSENPPPVEDDARALLDLLLHGIAATKEGRS
jgi:TetR/AcrR family transcriptional regulator, cholesterol catabolism regulator